MKHLLLLCLLAALAACHPNEATVPASVRAAEADARRDSAEAARLDTVARHYYALGKAAQDSATFYHLQAHEITPTAADSASLQRFFADYFTPQAR